MTGNWSWFVVVANAQEPIAMSSGLDSRNRASAFPFLTGTSVRGALAARWLRDQGFLVPGRSTRALDDRTRSEFAQFFESGDVRVPFLFPGSGAPVPLSRHECRGDCGEDPVDLAHPRRREMGAAGATCKRCSGGLERSARRSQPVRRDVRTRTAVGDDGVAARGMLYAQEELREGQVFRGMMAVRDGLVPSLRQWLPIHPEPPAELRLGADRSTSGLVRLTITPTDRSPLRPIADRRQRWVDAGLPAHEVVMTCWSPLILTDPWLRPAASFEPVGLSMAVGLKIAALRGFTLSRARPTGGWNPAAGLPKPVDTSLIEGSVATFVLDRPVDVSVLDTLADLESSGIGWRRAEGFGAVRFWDDRHLEDQP